MKQLAYFILACSLLSCQKSKDVHFDLDDPKDSAVVVTTYPFTFIYKGTIKVDEMHADMSPEYVHFDTVYTASLNVEYPDSTTVIFYLKYWGINEFGTQKFKGFSDQFKVNSTGVYLPGRYDFFRYTLVADSLIVRIHQSGGPSHGLDVNFAGVKVR